MQGWRTPCRCPRRTASPAQGASPEARGSGAAPWAKEENRTQAQPECEFPTEYSFCARQERPQG